MSKYHRREMKKLLGKPDFGPVLGSEILRGTATLGGGVTTETSLGAFEMPRKAQLKGIRAYVTGNLTSEVTFALTYGGVVAASGSIPAGKKAEATFIPLDRQNAVIVSSGVSVELIYAVPTALGGGDSLTVTADLDYISLV